MPTDQIERAAPAAPAPPVLDDWVRMETRLMVYKATRLMDALDRELGEFSLRVEDPGIGRSIGSTADLIAEAREMLGLVRDRL